MAGLRKSRFRGVERMGWAFSFAAAAYNLIRLSTAEQFQASTAE